MLLEFSTGFSSGSLLIVLLLLPPSGPRRSLGLATATSSSAKTCEPRWPGWDFRPLTSGKASSRPPRTGQRPPDSGCPIHPAGGGSGEATSLGPFRRLA